MKKLSKKACKFAKEQIAIIMKEKNKLKKLMEINQKTQEFVKEQILYIQHQQQQNK